MMNLQENIHRIKEMTTMGESKGWGDSNEKLEKTFKFKDFNDSMDFVNKVAKIAEKQQHHPDIEIKYDKVKVSITDHEKGGVSDKCHKLVKSIDDIEKIVRITKSDLVRIIKQEEMKEGELTEKWSEKYKKSINCDNPKGFSQKAHCDGKRKDGEMKEGELTEKCWTGYTQKGMKTMFGKQYPNCVKKTK